MRILTVSDAIEPAFLKEGQCLSRLAGVEAVFACGDLPASYLEYLVTCLNVPLFYVLGNHDEALYRRPISGCTCVDETTVMFRGHIIGGLSGSLRYAQGRLMVSEMQMHGKIARLFPRLAYNRIRYRRYIDILLTHAPILGVHDEATRVHRGFEALKLFDRQYRPRYHFHGHTMVRKGEVITPFHTTRIVNANPYQLLDI